VIFSGYMTVRRVLTVVSVKASACNVRCVAKMGHSYEIRCSCRFQLSDLTCTEWPLHTSFVLCRFGRLDISIMVCSISVSILYLLPKIIGFMNIPVLSHARENITRHGAESAWKS